MNKKVLKICTFSLLGIVLMFLLFALSLLISSVAIGFSDEKKCLAEQTERLEILEKSYAEGSISKVNEQKFCDFDVNIDVPYNAFRTIATHNSYKKMPSKAGEILMNMFMPLGGGVSGESSYDHDNFTDQLNHGIRSMEIDVIKKVKDDSISLRAQHAPFFDGNSWALDLEKGFKEIAMWSEYNPTHMPITLLIEGKTDFLLQSGMKKFDSEAVTVLEEMVDRVFGDNLLKPKDMLGNFEDFKSLREEKAVPSLQSLRGKVLVVLHPGGTTEEYLEKNISDMKLFPMTYDADKSLFVLKNNPFDVEEIKALVDKGFIVRTRIDQYLDYAEDRRGAALLSGAQILSSDYPPRLVPLEYTCSFGENKTMTLQF